MIDKIILTPMRHLHLFRVCLVLMTGILFSQSQVLGQIRFEADPSSTFSVAGTSTLHDWTCTSKEVKGFVVLPKSWVDGKPGKEEQVTEANISVAARSLFSGRGSIMDDKMYNALKDYDFPTITFHLVSGKITPSEAGKAKLDVTGDLSLAGKTQRISLTLEGSRIDGSTFNFKGSKALKMSDFEVEPPTAMFGQIVTDDLVTVNFNLKMIRK